MSTQTTTNNDVATLEWQDLTIGIGRQFEAEVADMAMEEHYDNVITYLGLAAGRELEMEDVPEDTYLRIANDYALGYLEANLESLAFAMALAMSRARNIEMSKANLISRRTL